jgi:DNA invertase Pin-like site-specific DNA recombinase
MHKVLSKGAGNMTVYGYARVSTDGQSLASQDAELHAAGCAKVYAEKISGARSNRPELAKVLKRLDTGDLLIVTRLDRLARSTRDLLNILDDIAKRGAGFKSLHDAWADTISAHPVLKPVASDLAANGEVQADLARSYGVPQATISRLQA